MQDEIAVNIQELTKLFVVCPNADCRAQIGFDLTTNQRILRVVCPACNSDVLETMRQRDAFDYSWVSLFKMILNAEGRPQMIFKLSRPVAEPPHGA